MFGWWLEEFRFREEIYLEREGLPPIEEAKEGKNLMYLYCSCFPPRTAFPPDILLLSACPLLLDPSPHSIPSFRPVV